MNFFNSFNMSMQERGKTKPKKKKAFPTWGEIKKKKKREGWVGGGGGGRGGGHVVMVLGPKPLAPPLVHRAKCLIWAPWPHVTAEELYQMYSEDWLELMVGVSHMQNTPCPKEYYMKSSSTTD